jgi:hypothetical protein
MLPAFGVYLNISISIHLRCLFLHHWRLTSISSVEKQHNLVLSNPQFFTSTSPLPASHSTDLPTCSALILAPPSAKLFLHNIKANQHDTQSRTPQAQALTPTSNHNHAHITGGFGFYGSILFISEKAYNLVSILNAISMHSQSKNASILCAHR